MKLIDDWRRAHKYLSIWVAAAIAAITAVEQFSPAFAHWMPSWWPAAGAALFAFTRVLKQNGLDQVPASLPPKTDV